MFHEYMAGGEPGHTDAFFWKYLRIFSLIKWQSYLDCANEIKWSLPFLCLSYFIVSLQCSKSVFYKNQLSELRV